MSPPSEAYVWVWLPEATEPVVAGLVQGSGSFFRFAYGESYLGRSDAISLYGPELPLGSGWIEPGVGLSIAGILRDGGPDAWGQRVIIHERFGSADGVDPGDVDQITYFLASGSNRIGALDFQASPTGYAERSAMATLDELHAAATVLAAGRELPQEMAAALVRGTSVGGARPKVTLIDGPTSYIAKFSVEAEPYPVVKAEAAGMELARRVGLRVPMTTLTSSLGRDVLLVERFDRPGNGDRRSVVSALTMLGLDEMHARYASYPELVDVLVRLGSDDAVGREIFERIVFNVVIGNNDDHARNHAAFWDGQTLSLTPAYDLCPQLRSGEASAQAMAIARDGDRSSSLALCVDSAAVYGVDRKDAIEVVQRQTQTVREQWAEVAEGVGLTAAERNLLFGRQILNPSIFYGFN